VTRSNFANGIEGRWPHISFVICAAALAGLTEWLAWKTSCNHVRKSSVFASGTGLYELTHITKDRSAWDESVRDSCGEHALAVVVPFDIADWSPTEQVRSEDSATRSGKEG